jgi:hypothetical protein
VKTSDALDLLPYLTPEQLRELDSLLPDPLELIRQDPAAILSLAGMAPDPWQAGLLRSSHPERLLLCARQAGKSTAAAALVLRYLLEPDSLVLILSETERQSKLLLHEPGKILWLYDRLGQPVRARKRQETSLTLANGSRVIALPDNPAGIVGYSSVSLLVIDEAALVSDELYQCVRPMLAVSKGDVIALSSPYGKRGWFYREWEQGDGWRRTAVDSTQCPRHGGDFIARETMRVGPRRVAQDYFLRFNDAVGQVFSQDVIDRAVSGYVESGGQLLL